MLDLTGANLAAYILRVCRDVVSSNPRFRQTLGDVSVFANNRLSFGDAQVIIKNISGSGNRLSSDYFMETQRGRAVVAKVGDKAGTFIEWVIQTDHTLIDPGVYYLNVTAIDEKTKNVTLTTKKFKWREGNTEAATGSWVFLKSGIDPNLVTITDALTPSNHLAYSVQQGRILLQTPVIQIAVSYNGSTLVPYTDYWYERPSTASLGTTTGGVQDFFIPGEWKSISVVDNTGYTLRTGLDYQFIPPNTIRTATWNPAGFALSVTGIVKVNPANTSATNQENFLNITLGPGETLAQNQVFVTTSTQDHLNLTVNPDGTVQLPYLMNPGESLHYEVRIDTGPESTVTAQKRAINPDLVPGFWVAIGDSVTVGDQSAIIVSPQILEIYDVYGSKDNVSFTLDVKANDLGTASEVAELLKQALLVLRRDDMERDGITIFEAARDIQGEARDESGTATRYIASLNVTSMCDWKIFIPLVTRVVAIDVQETMFVPYPSQLQVSPISRAFGSTQFIDGISVH